MCKIYLSCVTQKGPLAYLLAKLSSFFLIFIIMIMLKLKFEYKNC